MPLRAGCLISEQDDKKALTAGYRAIYKQFHDELMEDAKKDK